MEFKGLTSASHMSLPEAGYGSEEGYVGSEISGAVSGVTTPGASRLQASQLQQRSTTMQRLHHLRRRVQALEREVDTGKGEMIRIARVAAGAQKELDIAKVEMFKIAKVATAAQRELDIARGETRLLNKVINGLQQRLHELEGRGSVGSDHPALESGSSDDSWGP